MSNLPKSDSLVTLQKYVLDMNIERNFDLKDVTKTMLLLTEEVGELAKAVRKHVGMHFSTTTSTKDIREELADVQIVLLSVANILGEDMYTAVIEKEKKNQSRLWK